MYNDGSNLDHKVYFKSEGVFKIDDDEKALIPYDDILDCQLNEVDELPSESEKSI